MLLSELGRLSYSIYADYVYRIEDLKKKQKRKWQRVKVNKGAPGIDGITVDEIGAQNRLEY